jgi:FixJ family two-component response regulator
MTDVRPRVHVVEDDAVARDALCLLLDCDGWQACPHPSADQFLAASDVGPGDVVISDIRMPGRSGLDLLTALNARDGAPPVVLMTAYGEIRDAVNAMRAGAVDYLEKPVDPDRLLEVMRRFRGVAADPEAVDSLRRDARARLSRLTAREREVLVHLLRGETNKEIARALSLSHRTVEQHRGHIMLKTNAASFADLVRYGSLSHAAG